MSRIREVIGFRVNPYDGDDVGVPPVAVVHEP
jgi:hypothetical protein